MAVVVPEDTQKAVDELTEWASTVIVRSAPERTQVLDVVKDAKNKRKFFNNLFDTNIKMWHAGHKNAVAEKRRWTDRLDCAEKAGKDAVLKYDNEQERKRVIEQRRLQAIADEQARREKARLEKEAEKLKTPELKEARLEEAAAIVAPVVQIETVQKTEGVSTKKTWKARVIDKNLVPREYMFVDVKVLNALARATKGSIEVAGVVFYEDSSLAIR